MQHGLQACVPVAGSLGQDIHKFLCTEKGRFEGYFDDILFISSLIKNALNLLLKCDLIYYSSVCVDDQVLFSTQNFVYSDPNTQNFRGRTPVGHEHPQRGRLIPKSGYVFTGDRETTYRQKRWPLRHTIYSLRR